MNTLILSVLIFAGSISFADEETDKAIGEVQEMMKSPDFSKNASKNSPEAQQVADQVKALAGSSAEEQEIYKLAAEVLGNMKGQSVDDMKQTLEKAQSNPEAFANSWTPEQLAKLKSLSERLPASKTRKP